MRKGMKLYKECSSQGVKRKKEERERRREKEREREREREREVINTSYLILS
jgi:hypothetical protein